MYAIRSYYAPGRKMHRGNRAGLAHRGSTVAFGEYGLMALERCWIVITSYSIHYTKLYE